MIAQHGAISLSLLSTTLPFIIHPTFETLQALPTITIVLSFQNPFFFLPSFYLLETASISNTSFLHVPNPNKIQSILKNVPIAHALPILGVAFKLQSMLIDKIFSALYSIKSDSFYLDNMYSSVFIPRWQQQTPTFSFLVKSHASCHPKNKQAWCSNSLHLKASNARNAFFWRLAIIHMFPSFL